LWAAWYSYYGPAEGGGSLGDLKMATVVRRADAGGGWQFVGTSYYRYYLAEEAHGFAHGLKFVVSPEPYARMMAVGVPPEMAPDETLAGYADYFFTYDEWARVSREVVRGGALSYAFEYLIGGGTLPPGSPGILASPFNQWARKTVVTRGDGSQEIAYANGYSQTMLKVLRSHEGEWCRYWRFNEYGQPTLLAESSAVAGYDERNSFLATLFSNRGLIQETVYYGPIGPAPSRKYSISAREGELGEPVLLQLWEYETPDGQTYVPSIDRRNVGTGLDYRMVDYRYAYEWHSVGPVIHVRTTQLPVIAAEQNGSGYSNSIIETFDTYGHRVRRQIVDPVPVPDAVYAVETWDWDVARGGMTSHTVDPDVLHLVTTFVLDDQGRTIATIGPAHTIDLSGVATEIRRISWTVYMEEAREIRTASGYLQTAIPEDPGTLVNPVSITKMDLAGRVIEQIQAVRSSTAGPITAEDVFGQADYCRWSTTAYDNQAQLAAQRVYHHIPASGVGTVVADYGETVYKYDDMGRRCSTVSPVGTISWNVFETRGLVVASWIGTDDAEATTADPSGGGAAGNNMVQVDTREYDRGAPGANGWLTQVIAFTGPAQARVRTFDYDFRGRRTVTRGEHAFREAYVTNVPGQVTRTERWSDQGVTPQLVGRTESLFDDLGRRYRTVRYSVDPVTGSVGVHPLSDDTWYDPVGDVMKQRNPEDAGFEKIAYDGPRRVAHRYAGYASEEPAEEDAYAAAQSVAADFIFEQSDYTYDSAGNLVEEIKGERFHDASGMGPLGDPTHEPKARVLYSMSYADPLGRTIATANYGTNGGVAPGRPETVPERGDTVLVSTTDYNSRGEVAATADPNGIVNVREFDDAGRLLKTIENFGA
jgi:hypothetical protein